MCQETGAGVSPEDLDKHLYLDKIILDKDQFLDNNK